MLEIGLRIRGRSRTTVFPGVGVGVGITKTVQESEFTLRGSDIPYKSSLINVTLIGLLKPNYLISAKVIALFWTSVFIEKRKHRSLRQDHF